MSHDELQAISDKIQQLERRVKLQITKLEASTTDEDGRWITTEKGQKVFIPKGADVKETVEKAIERRKNKSQNIPQKQIQKEIEQADEHESNINRFYDMKNAQRRVEKLLEKYEVGTQVVIYEYGPITATKIDEQRVRIFYKNTNGKNAIKHKVWADEVYETVKKMLDNAN